MVKKTINKFGEQIQSVGDITLNLEYWDCECRGKNYIHSISVNGCHICKSIQSNQPNSRENEVSLLVLR